MKKPKKNRSYVPSEPALPSKVLDSIVQNLRAENQAQAKHIEGFKTGTDLLCRDIIEVSQSAEAQKRRADDLQSTVNAASIALLRQRTEALARLVQIDTMLRGLGVKVEDDFFQLHCTVEF